MGRVKFDVLDALRGLAAIFVVIRHSGEFFGGNPFYSSFLAVDIFFLLSGFVIAHAYDKKIAAGIINSREFIIIRLIRFYPAYILSIALCAVVAILRQKNQDAVGNFLLAAFFVPNFLQSLIGSPALFPINTVFWSLFYELGVNIFYGVTRKLGVNKLLAGMTVLSGLAILAFAWKDGSIDSGFSWGIGSIILGGTRAFFGIFLGIYLYKIRNHGLFARLQHLSMVGPLLLTGAILSMPSLGAFNWVYQAACVFLLFPVCVLWASKAKPSLGTGKALITLGLMSYPAYVLHVPATQILNHFFAVEIRQFAPFSGILFLVVFIAICVIVEKYYERPLIKMLRGWKSGGGTKTESVKAQ